MLKRGLTAEKDDYRKRTGVIWKEEKRRVLAVGAEGLAINDIQYEDAVAIPACRQKTKLCIRNTR